MRRFKIRIVGTKERMVVMGVVDPRVFTTERTLALPSRSKYSFEIVYLEEVVVRKVPKVVEYVPC